MKKTLKIISTISILLFGILWLSSKFISNELNTNDIQNILVVISLFTSLKYYQLLVKEKDEIIDHLRVEMRKGK